MKLCLVCESRMNAGVATPARDQFTSPYFKAAILFADANYDHWAILSTNVGVARPQDLLAPCRFTLEDQHVRERETWGRLVAQQIAAMWADNPITEVHLIGGDDVYADALRAGGVEFTRPLTGNVSAQMERFRSADGTALAEAPARKAASAPTTPAKPRAPKPAPKPAKAPAKPAPAPVAPGRRAKR